jgi:hypothetical protein
MISENMFVHEFLLIYKGNIKAVQYSQGLCF